MANYAQELGVQTPTQWLWDELEAHLPAEVFAKLKNGHAAQQRRYDRCSTLNAQARWVREMELQPSDSRAMRVAKWRAILTNPEAYVFSEEKE